MCVNGNFNQNIHPKVNTFCCGNQSIHPKVNLFLVSLKTSTKFNIFLCQSKHPPKDQHFPCVNQNINTEVNICRCGYQNSHPQYHPFPYIIISDSLFVKWLWRSTTINTSTYERPSWSWSSGSWIYNYMCNQFLSSLKLWVRIPLIASCTRYNII
jgi:hypothetical protein